MQLTEEQAELLKALADRADVPAADYLEALLNYAASINIRPGSWEASQAFNIHAYGPEGFADRWIGNGGRAWRGRL